MKKLILMSFFSAALMALAEDSYLYWEVQQDPSSGIQFDYAQVKADGSTVLGRDADRYLAADSTKLSGGPINTYFDSSYIGSTFIVELLNASDEVVGRSGSFGYEAISANIFGGKTPSGASPWTVSGFQSVPEPTSGVLVLIGLAGLALRRKRA